MSNNNTFPTRWMASLTFCALAILFSIYNIAHAPQKIKRLTARNQTIKELHKLKREQLKMEKVYQAYLNIENTSAAQLEDLLEEESPDYRLNPNAKKTPLLEGWVQENVILSANDIKLAVLEKTLARLHKQSFPWIMNECRITTIPGSYGKANVTLTLQTIRKTE